MNLLPAGWKGGTAKDGDIVRRRWLLVDCDPQRKGTVSSTDAEKELAYEKAFAVATFLESLGWPTPIIADSGNGWHLLYRIDLPAGDGGLVARVLKALARMFSDDAVDIDTKVGNASRICKLYGTLAAKGKNTPAKERRSQGEPTERNAEGTSSRGRRHVDNQQSGADHSRPSSRLRWPFTTFVRFRVGGGISSASSALRVSSVTSGPPQTFSKKSACYGLSSITSPRTCNRSIRSVV